MAAEKKVKKATKLPKGYKPSNEEKFMNAKQKEYFRQKLLVWRGEIIEQTKETVAFLQEENVTYPDPADTASANADRQLELRTKDRLRKLVNQIEKALARIEAGTYGYCQETGDPRPGRVGFYSLLLLTQASTRSSRTLRGTGPASRTTA